MPNQTRKRKRKLPWLLLILVLLCIVGVCFYQWYNSYDDLIPNRDVVAEDEDAMLVDEDRINVLLLGIDTSEEDSVARSDVIIVASISLKDGAVSLLSIPRDSRVTIPGSKYKDKINHSYAKGGLELTKQTVQQLLNVPIDYYVTTNFNGFKDIVNALGGITIDVEKRMYYKTYDGLINLQKGVQVLDGEKALQYVRFRHDALGDISRVERQQKFLTAVVDEMLNPANILRLPQVIPAVMSNVETDFTKAQLLKLAKIAGQVDFANVRTATYPGDFLNLNGASYWGLDLQKGAEVVQELFSDPIQVEVLPEGEQGATPGN